jgi:hypothetical protein
VSLQEDGKSEVELLGKILIALVLKPEQSLEIRGHAPGIRDLPSSPGAGARVLADQHGFVEDVSHPDLDIYVGLVEGSEIVEEAKVRPSDPRDDILKDIPRCQVITRPPEIDLVRLEQVDQIEAQGVLDAFEKAMPHKTGEISFAGNGTSRQALKKRKLASVRFSEVNEPKLAEASEVHGSGRLREELPTEKGQ